MMLEIVADEVTPTLLVIDERLSDFSAFNRRILEDAMDGARRNVGEKAFFGAAWPPMAPSTIAKGRDPSTLLVEHGDLADALFPGSPFLVVDVGPQEGSANLDLPGRRGYNIPAIQQYGADASAIPSRPFVGWDDLRLLEYEDWLGEYVMGDA